MFELYSGFLKVFSGTQRRISKNMQEILDYIGHSVEKHRETLDPNNPRDFIDTYLIRMEKVKSCVNERGWLRVKAEDVSGGKGRRGWGGETGNGVEEIWKMMKIKGRENVVGRTNAGEETQKKSRRDLRGKKSLGDKK